MPTISYFYGIAIRMFFNDHAPPHFHAFHGNHEAQVAIATGDVIKGVLPHTAQRLVREWTLRYHDELMANWARVHGDRAPERIPGLDAENDD